MAQCSTLPTHLLWNFLDCTQKIYIKERLKLEYANNKTEIIN